MSKFRVEVSGCAIVDADTPGEARERGLFLQDILNSVNADKYRVSVYDYDQGTQVSLKHFEKVVAFSGRQESEGLVQGIVRMLVQGKLINAAVNEKVAEITEGSMQLDEATRHYSVDYGKLHDLLVEFAVDADTFAVDFKNVLSDVLLNNATRGAAFMKKAKG